MKIPPDVREVLARSTFAPDRLSLPGQLERDMYLRVNKVIVAAGGKWDRRAQAHIFTRDPREVLGLAIETGTISDPKKELQQFYTPPELARLVVKAAGVKNHHIVLEPSAGRGALVEAVLLVAPHVRIKCIEMDPENVRHLRQTVGSDNVTIHEGDFLHMPHMSPHRVVMNPPFAKDQAIEHITHAWEQLRPGGVLVSISPPTRGHESSRVKARVAFARLLEETKAHRFEVPPGMFRQSGTMVSVEIIRMVKPSE